MPEDEQTFRAKLLAGAAVRSHPLQRVIEAPAHRLDRCSAQYDSLKLPAQLQQTGLPMPVT
jgi:hypothetical protein